MLHALPTFCNAPQYLINFYALNCFTFKLTTFRLFQLCQLRFARLFAKIAANEHSMRSMFDERIPTPRDASTIRAPFARTEARELFRQTREALTV